MWVALQNPNGVVCIALSIIFKYILIERTSLNNIINCGRRRAIMAAVHCDYRYDAIR